MLTLLLDLDNVCVPFTAMFQLHYEKLTGVFPHDAFDTHDQYRDIMNSYIQQSGIFRHMPIMSGCYDTLDKHSNNYEYVIVTSRLAKHHEDTRKWVYENLPHTAGIIFTSSKNKYRVRGDVVIDDNETVLRGFDGLPTITIKMAYAYNQNTHTDFIAYDWNEIDDMLRQITELKN